MNQSQLKGHIAGDAEFGANPLANVNPSDLIDVVGYFAQADVADVRAACRAARDAFGAWGATDVQARADILDRAGALLLARKLELGELLAREEGKTIAEAIGEVGRAGQIFKFFAGEAIRLQGELGPSVRPGIDVEVRREPVGVCALITPWNFPIAIPAWKLAPALAFGNTVVLKPAELTPASAHALFGVLREAGLPPGVANLVMGQGAVVGAALVDAPEVDAVSFTGSVGVGRALAVKCIANSKRVQCEMGGKNPLVVLDDADLDVAVNCAVNGAFYSTGQRCTASSRLIVTEAVHDEFVARLTQRMAGLRVGHALDRTTEIGPVVDERQLEKNLGYVRDAIGEGARAFGGELLRASTRGHFMTPALLVDTSQHMRINREEVFGPVATVLRAGDYEEALALANDTEFGLVAGICTRSLKYAQHFKRHAQVGMVMVNLPTAGVDYHVPFGGRKASSIGPREQGTYARDFYTLVKTAYVACG